MQVKSIGNAPRFCSDCGEALAPGARFCAACGASVAAVATAPPLAQLVVPAITCPNCGTEKPSPSPGCAKCGYIDTTLTALPIPRNTPLRLTPGHSPAAVDVPAASDGALTAAALLYFVMSGLLILLALLQIALSVAVDGAINFAIGVLFAFVGWWIVQRDRKGYDWGLWSALLNIVWGVALAFIAPSLVMIIVPLCVVAALLLWNNRQAFGR